jgi:hypothetical protein
MKLPRAVLLAMCFVTLVPALADVSAQDIRVSEDDQQIKIETPQLEAVVRKRGYVSGVAGGTFVDKKSGFRDAGFRLDIVDWIMEPGSDEAYRDQLPDEMVYRFDNEYHGKSQKRSIRASSAKPGVISAATSV